MGDVHGSDVQIGTDPIHTLLTLFLLALTRGVSGNAASAPHRACRAPSGSALIKSYGGRGMPRKRPGVQR